MSLELKAFQIGDVTVASPVVLAALAGYSDLPYRRLCRRLGAPYCATEMLLDKSVIVAGKLQRRLLTLTDDDHPVAGQLIGCEPDDMAHAASLLSKAGFDAIDLNFACPVRKALARFAARHCLRLHEDDSCVLQQKMSIEHAAYIGYELHRAESTPDYVQD